MAFAQHEFVIWPGRPTGKQTIKAQQGKCYMKAYKVQMSRELNGHFQPKDSKLWQVEWTRNLKMGRNGGLANGYG